MFNPFCFVRFAKRLFSYAIAKEPLSLPPTVTTLLSEDRELNTHDRKKAIARSREIPRDFSIVQWALDKHADYTSRFNFQSHTGIKSEKPARFQ
jgi:hypothetical protein